MNRVLRPGGLLLAGHIAGAVWPVRAALGEPLTGHDGPVDWGAWGLVEGRAVLATGGRGVTVRLWDGAREAALGKPLTGHGSEEDWEPEVNWGAWGLVGGRAVLATGGFDGVVRLWDAATGAALGEPLTGHGGPVLWGAWGGVGGRAVLAAGGFDRTVRLWEVVEVRPVPRVPAYRSDVTAPVDELSRPVDELSRPVDELSRRGDAVALAELVTAITARPPLAVGLFGDWGEGKSHFLDLLAQQVRATARPDNPLAHSAVRQVRFNAWHYAETDLWASLVAELFAQLATPPDGDRGAEQRRQSRLASELVAKRGLRERLAAARGRRDDLQEALHRAERDDLGSWNSLTKEQKDELAKLTGDNPKKFYREAVRTAASLRETGRGSWRFLRSLRPATLARLGAVLAVVVAAAVVVAWLIPALTRWSVTASVVATLAAVVELWRRVGAETAKRAGKAWKTAVRMAEAQRQRLQTAADLAAAEVVALEREVQDLTAAGQLAGMVADRAADGGYRRRLGLMTQIREDFTNMAGLLAGAAGSPAQTAPGPRQARSPGTRVAPRTRPRRHPVPTRPRTRCRASTGSSSTSMILTGARRGGWWRCWRPLTCCSRSLCSS